MAPSTSKLALRDVTPAQFTEAMSLQMRTFNGSNDHLHHLCFPGDPDADPATAAAHAKRFAQGRADDAASSAEVRYWQAVDTEANNDMAACALWEFWPDGKAQATPKVTWVPNSNDGEDGALLRRYVEWAVSMQHGARARHLSSGPYAQLEVCFTSSAHRRKGAGGIVLDAGVARAEELGLDAYIEASPEGRMLYETRGFQCIEEVQPECPAEFRQISEGGRIKLSFMKRPCGGWKD